MWSMLEKETQRSFCTALWIGWYTSMAQSCPDTTIFMYKRGLSELACRLSCRLSCGTNTVKHPIAMCITSFEHLLQEMVDKKSKTILAQSEWLRKALFHIKYCCHNPAAMPNQCQERHAILGPSTGSFKEV